MPRVRAVLRLLAVHAGNPVHREVLQMAFWPDADAETGARNLHVAVSSLRSWLEPGVARGGCFLPLRGRCRDRLAPPTGAHVVLWPVSNALAAPPAACLPRQISACTPHIQ